MPNRLAGESSPYLLQHKDNPVDWYSWGEEALARAKAQDKPLLVSVGYSACHWCHVMERESFEDPNVAAVMNEQFICIKVDREERPDIDAICMEACHAITGQGGWPLNTFLTPERIPFYAGTYFPPEPRSGMPSWTMVLEAVAKLWAERREDVIRHGDAMVHALQASAELEGSSEPIREPELAAAVSALQRHYDRAHGGFGRAPKFPQASIVELLAARGGSERSLAPLQAVAQRGTSRQTGG
ncbi:MAG: thioredoxin domain-containing protein, partial [Solirubrobacteraceae bacterium]